MNLLVVYSPIALVCVFAMLFVRSERVYLRVGVTLVAVVCSAWLASMTTEIRMNKENAGHLSVTVGQPYIKLCKHLEMLSRQNSSSLDAVLSNVQSNSTLMSRSWLGNDELQYRRYVESLIENTSSETMMR